VRTVIVVLVALLTACARFAPGADGSASPEPSAGAPDLAGAWVLRQGRGSDGEIVVPDDYRITLIFTGDEIGGQACNHYGGDYQLSADGTLRLGVMSMTEMACAEPMMTAEAAYHAALNEVRSVARAGDVLTLSGEGTELVFELLPPVPDAALQGTRWVLESLVSGDAVSSVQGDAWLVLEPDGTMTGSTGCRDLSGRYVVRGDQVAWTDLRADGECGARLEQQDRAVLGVLEQPIVTVEGDRLTLMLPNGEGLAFRAAEG
jgi:heat shock protein HslJ